jgi:hypothetical protein
MSVEDLILTALQLRACYVGFKADLKARHECHGFSRWYKSSLSILGHIWQISQFNSVFWCCFVI